MKPTLREWLAEAPFGLSMSSGFFAFFAHCGVAAVLEDEGVMPSRMSGSSAGALVAGTVASGTSARVLRDRLLTLERKHFWDPRPGFGLLRGDKFRQELRAIMLVQNFADCVMPVAVSVHDIFANCTRVVDDGDLPVAVSASCAFPGLFQPVRVAGRWVTDGGVSDRPGLAGMPAGERVLYHHIASRSPWRRKGSAALQIPNRPNLVPLVIHGLPRLGPFKLELAQQAYDTAAAAMRVQLDAPL